MAHHLDEPYELMLIRRELGLAWGERPAKESHRTRPLMEHCPDIGV
jgi:hypothetical protein